MFKRFLAVLLVCLLPLFSLTACDGAKGESPTICTVTFVQTGQENIVKTVEYGKELTDIPTPKEVVGHDVVWSVSDFSKVTSDMTVTAVATPKTYTIYYTLSQKAMDDGAVLEIPSQQVTYGQSFTLIDVTYISLSDDKEYVLAYWKYNGERLDNGVYNFAHDIELISAHFEPIDTPEWS